MKLISVLGMIHNQCEELHMGEYKELVLQCGHYVFARVGEKSAVITAVNNEDREKEVAVSLPWPVRTAVNLITGETSPVSAGKITLNLCGHDGELIRVFW